MGERTSFPPGAFCWVELATTDVAAAAGFYGRLLGWEGDERRGAVARRYTMFHLGGRLVAAMSERHDGAPAWLSYVSVADADAAAGLVPGLGGLVVQSPTDVLDAGRLAVVADPTGALVALWQPGAHIGATLVDDPGALCLNQLGTTDPDRARPFYEGLFGWAFTPAGPGGPPSWGISHHGARHGAMVPLTAGDGPASRWLPAFATADLDDAVATVPAAGGAVAAAPTPGPGGRMAVAADPQGAAFVLVEGGVDP